MKKLLQISITLAALFGAAAVQAQDVKAGEKKVAMCIGCHGIPGYQASFPEIHKVPMIAGQHADYLTVALKSYKTEKNANVGRSNGVMAGQVKQFSNAELKAIAGYIASLPGELATVPQSKMR